MANTELLNELQSVVGNVYRDLNANGVNLQARHDVLLVTYAVTGGDGHKRKRGALSEISSQALTVIRLQLKNVTKYSPSTGSTEVIGDALLEVSQDDVSEATLRGTNLADKQLRYFVIADERYTLLSGSLKDDNGLKWLMALKKEAGTNP